MIRHQAPGPYLAVMVPAGTREQPHVGAVVIFNKKGLLTAVTALGDVVWNAGEHYTRQTGHKSRSLSESQVKYTVPLIP